MDTILKLSPVIAVVIITFLLVYIRYTKKDETFNSNAHEEALKFNTLANNLYSEEQKVVEAMEALYKKMLVVIDSTSMKNTGQTKLALEHNKLIAKCKGLLEKHKLILEQHQQYIGFHENTSINSARIQAQHLQIKEDYFSIKMDAQFIKDQFDQLDIDQNKIT